MIDHIPFLDLLGGDNYAKWVPSFAAWEPLRKRISDLEDRRKECLRCGPYYVSEIRNIDRQLAELQTDIKAHQPWYRYCWADSKVVLDVWGEFVTAWRNLQVESSIPLGPTGKPLAGSTPQERKAWEKLISHILPKEESRKDG